jgi:C_GCAxxG_C_C family probable redox protein
VELFRDGYVCAEGVLMAYGPDLGLDQKTAQRLALPLGGGLAHCGKTCGAVTGALLVLGLKSGTTTTDDKPRRKEILGQSRRFMEAFATRCGSVECSQLLGCDISTPEGFAVFQSQNLRQTKCVKLVEEATNILDSMLPSSVPGLA